MDCGGEDGALEDFVDLVSDITDSSSTILGNLFIRSRHIIEDLFVIAHLCIPYLLYERFARELLKFIRLFITEYKSNALYRGKITLLHYLYIQ